MNKFNRRIYRSLPHIVTDVWAIVSRRKEIRQVMHGDVIDRAFRERLMLAVTQVNGCRYCSYAHARMALTEGISAEEIHALGEGMFDGSPAAEIPALLYAQHWAEADGQPDPEVRLRAAEQYGDTVVKKMELVLQMIRMGNLLGNTWDYLLYRVSFGHWGV